MPYIPKQHKKYNLLHFSRENCENPLRVGNTSQKNNTAKRLKGLFNFDKNVEVVNVVAALIWDKDKFLICQRPKHKARPLLWEFVGGKVEYGETKKEALMRECKEELGIAIKVGDIFMETFHEYPDISINLSLFNATIASGSIKLIEHNDIRWISTDEILKYEFCPADEEILRKLQG